MTTTSGCLSIFDIDDTLFHTTAQIAVIKDNSIVDKLSNQQFNTYKLKLGESFDFSEFEDSTKFFNESTPINRMMMKAKILLRHSSKNPMNKVIIVTARSNFNNRELFLDTFRKYDFDIDKVRVERAGNITDIHDNAVKKFIIIRNYLNTNSYNKVRFFDDNIDNLTEFLKLRHEFPDIKFQAFFANPDGSVITQ